MITKIQARFFIWAIAFIALAAVAGPLASGASATDAFELFGHDNENSEIEMIDTSTGVETTVGPTGLSSRASAMATSRASADTAIGTLEAGTNFALLEVGATDHVVVIDTVTGAATIVVTTSREIKGRGIGFGSDGSTLFVIEGNGEGPLSTIDLTTGVVTLVANTGTPSDSLQWDPVSGSFLTISDGNLHSVTEAGEACTISMDPGTGTWYTIIGGHLSTLDPLTGSTTVVTGAPATLGLVCGTAFAPVTHHPSGVHIDIKPNSDPSSYSCKSRGNIPVAVLGSSTFDATQIDAGTVLFGATGSETGEVHTKKGIASRHVEDFNEDGFDNMIFHFDFRSTGFSCDDIPPGEKSVEIAGLLTGELEDGTPIEGEDILRLTSK